MKAVIQAGGKGTRLRPYTLVLPKPMMPIGENPVIETLLKWLRRNGIEEVYITTGHLGHLLQTFCGDGEQWGLHIEYSEEPEPLGTVGALTLLRDKLDENFLMLNGDLVTDLSIRQFTESHRLSDAPVSVATTRKKVPIDFGVLDVDENNRVEQFREKPVFSFLVSMGLYMMNPSVLELIPKGIPFGFDDLMAALLDKGQSINTFEHTGLWMDIGRVEDFQKAQEDWSEHGSPMLGV